LPPSLKKNIITLYIVISLKCGLLWKILCFAVIPLCSLNSEHFGPPSHISRWSLSEAFTCYKLSAKSSKDLLLPQLYSVGLIGNHHSLKAFLFSHQ
jgi:hypothetical protein